MKHKYPVVVLILFLAIGYAGVSVVHKINGNINISYDENNFNVGITRVSTSYGTTSFKVNSLNFKTITLKETNNEALLEFEIANKSLVYDAEVNVSCKLNENSLDLSEYLKIKTDIVNPVKITSGNGVIGQLSVNMKKTHQTGITPEITCTITSIPTSRTSTGKEYIESYKDPVLNGADPVVKDKLVPIKLAMDGTVEYADTTKRWYSYKNKEWANAVILIDNPSKSYHVNDIISESDIESYFVWIPRYRYQIFNLGNYTSYINSAPPATSNAQEIQIEFENIDKQISKGTTKGSWLTHPAFTNYNTNGIWVGKFETGYKGASTQGEAEKNVKDAGKVIIKPNVYSWRKISVSNIFKTALEYAPSLNSHMMRNTEWGAAAYLSHSKYGINGEVRVNGNSEYLTGYAANERTVTTDTPENSPYNTEIGYSASTTGNITGIYDMSGCGREYVAGYVTGKIGSSGFTTGELSAYKKHFDIYASSPTLLSYGNRILGDATGEMGPFYKSSTNYVNNWYNDISHFAENSYPWFQRGGVFIKSINYYGQFFFGRDAGQAININSSRITIAI